MSHPLNLRAYILVQILAMNRLAANESHPDLRTDFRRFRLFLNLPASRNHRSAVDDIDALLFERLNFVWVVRQYPNPLRAGSVLESQSEVMEDGTGDLVASFISLVSQHDVGSDSVVAQVLQIVGSNLRQESNTPPLLPEVDDGTSTWYRLAAREGDGLRNLADSLIQLFPAIASHASDSLAGKALGMNSNERCRNV